MGQSKKKANQRRHEEEKKEEVSSIPKSELCPDLLRCVFKRLNFMDLNRIKSVCSSWHSASRGCKPKQNQIPWLILFPRKEEEGNTDNNSSNCCVLFVPEDKDNVYKTRDLGVDFVSSFCLASYGSWLLMMDYLCRNLYIINPLTGERIDLPDTKTLIFKPCEACFWMDKRSKDYLVVLKTQVLTLFTKKGVSKWHEFPSLDWVDDIAYNHKNQKLYVYDDYNNIPVKIWDFSGDKPREDGFLDCGWLNYDAFGIWENILETKTSLAVTISGDVLMVACVKARDSKTWHFCIFKANHKWDRIDSLGDEALILDMGVTVVAKDVLGIKRNSIYFSGAYCVKDDPENIFVFDLTTQKIEPLPQCVFSSMQFSDARWFFPGFNC